MTYNSKMLLAEQYLLQFICVQRNCSC